LLQFFYNVSTAMPNIIICFASYCQKNASRNCPETNVLVGNERERNRKRKRAYQCREKETEKKKGPVIQYPASILPR